MECDFVMPVVTDGIFYSQHRYAKYTVIFQKAVYCTMLYNSPRAADEVLVNNTLTLGWEKPGVMSSLRFIFLVYVY